jgi:hypothetical protein
MECDQQRVPARRDPSGQTCPRLDPEDLAQLVRFCQILLEWDERRSRIDASQSAITGGEGGDIGGSIHAGRAVCTRLVEGPGT